MFTGIIAIYFCMDTGLDDRKGHVMKPNQPLAVCDETAAALLGLARDDLQVSASTWFYDGGGCC